MIYVYVYVNIYNMALKLTSVKLEERLFEDFKVASIRQKFNLQKLVNRSIHLYLTNEEFAKALHTHTDLTVSGSGL